VSGTILPGTRRGGDGKSNGPICKGSVAGAGLGTARTIGAGGTRASNTDAGSKLGTLNLGLSGAEATLLSSSGSASTAPIVQLRVVTNGGPRAGLEPPGATGGRSLGGWSPGRPRGGAPVRCTAAWIAGGATRGGTLGRGLGADAAPNRPSPARPTGTRAVRTTETTAVGACRVRDAPEPKATGTSVVFLDAFPGGLDALPEGLRARFRDGSPPAMRQ
jgi:hypothetical protein